MTEEKKYEQIINGKYSDLPEKDVYAENLSDIEKEFEISENLRITRMAVNQSIFEMVSPAIEYYKSIGDYQKAIDFLMDICPDIVERSLCLSSLYDLIEGKPIEEKKTKKSSFDRYIFEDKIKRLLYVILNDFAEYRSNCGCNDTPDSWLAALNQKDRHILTKICCEWNQSKTDGDIMYHYDWILLRSLAEYIIKN
jgi:hypothetical protein